jgi:hypothetical protein
MPSTDSAVSEKVVGIRRFQWTACSGIGGRHVLDSLVALRRNTQPLTMFADKPYQSPFFLPIPSSFIPALRHHLSQMITACPSQFFQVFNY